MAETHTIRVDIVSAEGEIFSGDATMVFAPGSQGDLGIYPRHAPLLTLLKAGEVRVLTPGDPQSEALNRTTETPAPTLYVQAGAFAVAANAQSLLQRLQRAGLANSFVLPPQPSGHLYRVRVGPVASVAEFDALAARLATLGVPDARLAPD